MTVDDFPLIVIPPAMSDDDNNFHSDILYFRALLNDIADLVFEKRFASPYPIGLSDELAAATELMKKVKW